MDKAYDPKAAEGDISEMWESSGAFTPIDPKADDPRFMMVLPPPNRTGVLHLGHAMTSSIEDALVRYHRMRGDVTLWLPGTDHAAIATQSKVERQIYEKEGLTRHDLGREELLKRIKGFAQESHDTIVNQLRRIGSSLDWTREAYTLDNERNLAVRVAFKKMYDEGLIYRGYRVINWDPIGQTTVSDEELVYKEVEGKFYTFRYSKDFPIPISTTRPETKVGDTAVAVHPDDKRYKDYVGKEYSIEFCGASLNIKVVADKEVDMEFGTGAVGVTPAHSVADEAIQQRHNLDSIHIINEDATMLPAAGSRLLGMDTHEARKEVIKWLKEEGLMEKEEKIMQNISTAERTGGVIEPLPKLQWFIDVNKEFERKGKMISLKSLMQDAVNSKGIRFIPGRFTKTYFHWIDNLRDWNISRQIWFGHRVPVWYRDVDGKEEIYVDIEPPAGEDWEQDDDTLDTWFSSGLWTFSTLGWPDENAKDFKNFHPNSVLETGYDILFFWIAKMILMSTYLLDEIPFDVAYLHGMTRDSEGKKMSKSKGNAIDPLIMMDEYGTDAVRLSLVLGMTPGNDLHLSEEKIAGYRNFVNKLWNVSRFIKMSGGDAKDLPEPELNTLADRWIASRFATLVNDVTKAIDDFQLGEAGEAMYSFLWNDFADWYLEASKVQEKNIPLLQRILKDYLKLLHPLAPFVTEKIWQLFEFDEERVATTQAGIDKNLLAITKWPSPMDWQDSDAESKFSAIKETVTSLRHAKADQGNSIADAIVDKMPAVYEANIDLIKSLAAISGEFKQGDEPQDAKNVLIHFDDENYKISITFDTNVVIDLKKHQADVNSLKKVISIYENKLNNKDFVDKAPAELVQDTRDKLAVAKEKLEVLESQLLE